MSGIGGIILLGGQSARMGTDKYLLPFFNLTLIERLCGELAKAVDEILLVTNEPQKLPFLPHRIISDIHTKPSALTGLHAGLVHSFFQRNFVLACDLPLFDSGCVAAMKKKMKDDTQIVIAESEKGFESLCGIYSKDNVPLIERMFKENNLRISDLYTQSPTVIVRSSEIESQTHPDVFFNMNTPEEYEAALEKYKKINRLF